MEKTKRMSFRKTIEIKYCILANISIGVISFVKSPGLKNDLRKKL